MRKEVSTEKFNKTKKISLVILLFLSCLIMIGVFYANRPKDFSQTSGSSENYNVKTYNLKQYNVKFILNGGQWKEENQYNNGEMLYNAGDKIKEPQDGQDFYQEGCTLEGWYTDTNFENEWNFEDNVVNQDISLFAKWRKNKYKVSFYNQYDNEKGESELLYETEVEYGYRLILSGEDSEENKTFTYKGEEPKRDRYNFVEWSSSTGSYVITQDTSFSARYTSDTLYVITVKYAYPNGTVATESHVTTKVEGDTYDIQSPQILGYEANIKEIKGKITEEDVKELEKQDNVEVVWTEGKINACNIYINVIYQPLQSEYQVKHYKQNTDLNGYTLVEVEKYDNVYVGDEVVATDKIYEGFHTNEEETVRTVKVKADGTAAANIYYDRNNNYMYISNSGDIYYDPVAIAYEQNISDLAKPERAGFVFDGWTWSLTAEGEEIPKPEIMPNRNIYVRGKWKAVDTTYTLSFYIENADDESYTNIGTATENGASESNLQNVNLTTAINTGFNKLKKDYQYFTYDEEKTRQMNNNFDVKVQGDGTTVVGVYFSRNTYTIEFNLNDSSYNTKAELTVEGEKYTTATGKYSFTAKYEQNIASIWPTYDNYTAFPTSKRWSSTSTYKFSGWSGGSSGSSNYTSKRLTLTSNLISNSTANSTTTFTANYSTSGSESKLYYMFESFDQTNTTTSETRKLYNGKYYDSQIEYYQTAFSSSTNWSAKDIEGVTNVGKGSSGNTTYFYYDRNTLNVTLYNVNQNYKNEVVKYGQSTESIKDLRPDEYPIKTPGNGEWKFEGWYRDPSYNIPVEWTDADGEYIQIKHDITLYAKWSAPKYNILFDLDGGTWTDENPIYSKIDDNNYQINAEEGTNLVKPTQPERYAYNFNGWYYKTIKDGKETEVEYIFEPSQKVYDSIKLTAKWSTDKKVSYRVKYIRAEYDEDNKLITDVSQYSKIEEVTEDKVVDGILFGTKISEEPINVINSENETFYVADESFKVLILNSMNEEDNTIYFFYTTMPELNCTAYYVKYTGIEYERGEIPDNSVLLAEPDVIPIVSGNGTEITVIAKNIPGYSPRTTWIKQSCLISDTTKNTVYFYYEEHKKSGDYTINYYFMDREGRYSVNPDYISEGTKPLGTVIETKTFEDENKADVPNFKGHEIDENNSDVYGVVTDSKIVLNVYYKNSIYKVNYNLQGGTWADTSNDYTEIDAQNYQMNVVYTYNANEPVEPSRGENYEFLGWFEVKSGETGNYIEQQKYDFTTAIEEDKKLYAVWKETQDATIEKKWEDDNNRDGIRPENISINILKNDKNISEIELNSKENATNENTWSKTLTLDKYDYDSYTIAPIYEDIDGIEKVELNQLSPEKAITKVCIVPDSAGIENGDTLEKITNATAVYTLQEPNVPTGYTENFNQETLTITNTHNPELIDKTVTKIWRDNHNKDGFRADNVTIQLKKNGENYGSTVVLSDGNMRAGTLDEWEYTFNDLYKYENGQEITYTVEEINPPALYSQKYIQKDLKIYNAYPPEVDIVVEKKWEDNNNQDGIRAQEISVQLQADGSNYGKEIILNEENNWTYSWEYLEKYNDSGDEYNYTIKEITEVPGYTTTYTDNKTTYESRFIITNTHEVEKTTKTVTKIWDDNNNQDGKRPENVEVQLKANDEDYGETILLNEENSWTYTWNQIDKNYNEGQEITYTVEEKNIPEGYEASYDQSKLEITNSYEPIKISQIAIKNWYDNNDEAKIRPNSIEVQLKADGENYGDTVTLNEEGNWTAIWENLDKYKDGKEIKYEVEEKEVPEHYEVEYSSDTFGITNKLKDCNYKVKYYYSGVEDITKEENEKAKYGSTITDYTDKTIDGYELDKVEGAPLTISDDENADIIRVYYKKRTDLSYTVNYLEKETNEVLHTAKEEANQVFESVINSANEIIEIEGYNYDSADKENITITTGKNVINIYYTKRDDLSYVVNYLEKDDTEDNSDNKVLSEQKVVNGQTFKATVTENAIDITGYEKPEIRTQTIEIKIEDNVINFYYTKRTDLSYVVNYLEKDEDDDNTNNKVLHAQKMIGEKTYQEVVTEEAIEIEGYDKVEPTTQEITIEVENNTINFYYTKRTDLSYVVNYLEKDDTEDNSDNKVLSEQKVVNGQTYKDIVTEEAIEIEGYDKVEPTTQEITIEVEDNIINFYYTKRTDLSYVVNYLEKDDTEDNSDNKVLSEQKVVNGQTYKDKVTEEAVEIEGYDKVEPTTQEITIEVENNIINFYYTKRTNLSYTVNYLEKDTNAVIHSAKKVENVRFEDEITSSSEIITIDGYEYNSIDKGKLTIGTNPEENVINIYYTKVGGLSYTVKYLEKDNDDDETNNKILHDPKIESNMTFEDVVLAKDEIIEINGYNYNSASKDKITIGTNKNEIIIYYTKRDDLNYTINYLEKTTNKVLHEEKVTENVLFETEVLAEDEIIEINGYNYDSVDKDKLVVGTTAEENIINIYYTKRNDLSYTINYLEKGTNEIIKEAKLVENVTFESEILSENEVEQIYGYNFDSSDKEKLVIQTEENVINLYYTKKDAKVTVHYYEENTENSVSADVEINGKVFDNYETIAARDVASKYELIGKPENAKGEMTEEEIIVNYYYRKKKTQVIVHYYEEGTNNKLSENIIINGRVDDTYETVPATDIPIKYELSTSPNNATGIMTEETIELTYYYRVKDSSLIIKYLEKGTNEELAKSEMQTGKVIYNRSKKY